MNITEFLLARIAEDEMRANYYGPLAMGTNRVLAECAAKRAIIESYENIARAASKPQPNVETALTIEGMREGTRMALAALTYPYKDHADWRQDWALNAR